MDPDVGELNLPSVLDGLLAECLEQSSSLHVAELRAKLFAGSSTILKLKRVHREMCEDSEALRETTADAKIQLDQSSLQLQSLLYEKHHYEKEIRSCMAFKSAYPHDTLELLSLEEYRARRPAAASTAAAAAAAAGVANAAAEPSATSDTEADPHSVMLSRLQHELDFRRETLAELEALKAQRDALAAEVAGRRSALSGLDTEISKMRAAALKVQKQYGIVADVGGGVDRLAGLLPPPLYMLYTHLRAAAAATAADGKALLQVSIGGKQAAALQKQIQSTMLRSPSAPAGVFEAAMTKAVEEVAKEAVVGGAAAAAVVFPLTVCAAIHAAEVQAQAPAKLIATFRYAPNLHLVTVEGGNKAQQARLDALFGEEEAAAAGADVAALPGKACAWAQRVAGLDLLPPALAVRGGAESAVAVQRYQHERRAVVVVAKLMETASKIIGCM